MTMYGVYSLADGTVVSGGHRSEEEAAAALQERVAEGLNDPDELEVEELCDDHPDQVAYNCPYCVVDLGSCPYFARHYRLPGNDPNGICGFGCVEEPACVTDEPAGGWPSVGREIY